MFFASLYVVHISSDTGFYPGMFRDAFQGRSLDRSARDEEPLVVDSVNGLGWHILRAFGLNLTKLDEVFASFYACVRVRPVK